MIKYMCIVVAALGLLTSCSTSSTSVAPQATVRATAIVIQAIPATETPTFTPTDTPTTTATASYTPAPSPTPTPTTTPMPTRTPTITATSTPAATKTPVPTPTIAVRYPPVSLREPPDGFKKETVAILFEWEDIGLNRDGDNYLVQVRRASSPTWEKTFNPGNQRRVTWGREQAIGYGDLVWTVSVVDAAGQLVSAQGPERKFYWCHPRSGCQVCSTCHR